MSIRGKQAARAIAVSLIITLFQVYVLASGTRPNINTGMTTPAPAGMVFGKLSLPENRVMLVNGNSAATGTTIFSGAQLQTPVGVEASVQLGAAGHLDIAPDSLLTVTFDNASVDVKVAKGSVALGTGEGVKGTVTNADGTVETSNSATPGSIIGRASVGKAARAAALNREEKAALIIIPIIITAIIIWVAASNDDDDNVSATSPNKIL